MNIDDNYKKEVHERARKFKQVDIILQGLINAGNIVVMRDCNQKPLYYWVTDLFHDIESESGTNIYEVIDYVFLTDY
jgi:hypothetical protein